MSKNRWCFTVNNYGDWRPVYNAAEMDYLVYGLEVGEQGTPHAGVRTVQEPEADEHGEEPV